MTDAHVPIASRRSLLAGLGVGAIGGVGLTAASPAQAGLGEPSIPSDPDPDFFLKLATIPGDVDADAFTNQIQLLTWGWGAHNPGDPLAAGGGGTGRAVPDDFIFLARSTSTHRRLSLP